MGTYELVSLSGALKDTTVIVALTAEIPLSSVHETLSLLTPREQEVAALIAHGLTNREIATRMVITERTAESHVQHILEKLGVNSRGRIAAWAVEHGLHIPSQG